MIKKQGKWPVKWAGENAKEYRFRCVLSILERKPGSTITDVLLELLDVQQTTAQTVGQTLNVLLERGQVTCDQSGDDKRVFYWYLTEGDE